MLNYILRRILATVPVLAVVAVFAFLLLELNPGDAAAIIAGEDASSADIERIRQALGLDQPFPVRFVTWLGGIVVGDMGTSLFNNRPVFDLIMQRVEPTGMIALMTITISICIAIPLGIVAAYKAGTWVDRAVTVFAVMSFSIPIFLVGYLAMYVFSMQLRLMPVVGYTPLAAGDLWATIRSLILPSAALGLAYSALLTRMTRSTMLEILDEDYIRTARAKGLSLRPVLIKHALRNAAVPIVTTIGVAFASLLGGVVVTENVFAIPGLGRLLVDAILQRDVPVVQGVVLFAAFTCVMVNLLIDISYTWFDPRIRY